MCQQAYTYGNALTCTGVRQAARGRGAGLARVQGGPHHRRRGAPGRGAGFGNSLEGRQSLSAWGGPSGGSHTNKEFSGVAKRVPGGSPVHNLPQGVMVWSPPAEAKVCLEADRPEIRFQSVVMIPVAGCLWPWSIDEPRGAGHNNNRRRRPGPPKVAPPQARRKRTPLGRG